MYTYPEVAKVFKFILSHDDVRRATFYGSPTFTIKATRLKKVDKRGKAESYILTLGRPNFAERKFIKDCQKAGEPFPVRDVQLTSWPVKRNVKPTKVERVARKILEGRRATKKEVRSLSAAALSKRR